MKNFLYSTAILVLFACSGPTETGRNNTKESDEQRITPYQISFEKFTQKEEGCQGEDCTKVDIQIVSLNAGDSAVCAKVNQSVISEYHEMVRSRLSESINSNSVEVLAGKFLEGYEMFKAEFPEDPSTWYLEISAEESSLLGDSVYCVNLSVEDYLGGAHGNRGNTLLTYSLTNGKLLDLHKMYAKAIKSIAEKKFRTKYEIAEGSSLNEAGFIFPEGSFVLPENIGYSQTGITLIYNPYEVAPYAMGSTVIDISFEEIESIEN